MRRTPILILLGFCLFGLLAWSEARAHFLLNVNVRIIIVEHLEDGLRVYLRLSMPYLVADKTGPEQADGTPAPAPYTTNRLEDGQLMHLLDTDAVARDPKGLGQLVAGDLFNDELVVRQISIECIDHPIPVEPDLAWFVLFVAVRVGVARRI